MLQKKILLVIGLLSLGFQSLEAAKVQKKGRFIAKVKKTVTSPFIKVGKGIVYCAQKTKDGCEYIVEKSFNITKVTAKYATIIYVTTTVGVAIYVYCKSEKVSMAAMKDLVNAGLPEGQQLTDEQLTALLDAGSIDHFWQTPFGQIPVTKNFVGNINAFVDRSNDLKERTHVIIAGATKKLQKSFNTTKKVLNSTIRKLTKKVTDAQGAQKAAEDLVLTAQESEAATLAVKDKVVIAATNALEAVGETVKNVQKEAFELTTNLPKAIKNMQVVSENSGLPDAVESLGKVTTKIAGDIVKGADQAGKTVIDGLDAVGAAANS